MLSYQVFPVLCLHERILRGCLRVRHTPAGGFQCGGREANAVSRVSQQLFRKAALFDVVVCFLGGGQFNACGGDSRLCAGHCNLLRLKQVFKLLSRRVKGHLRLGHRELCCGDI